MIEVLFSKNAEKIYQKLKKSKLKEDRILLKAIDYKIVLLKEDAHTGIQIKKKQIPKELHVKTLFRIPLPCFWRMIYTLDNEELKVIAIVIEISNHKKYDYLMKY